MFSLKNAITSTTTLPLPVKEVLFSFFDKALKELRPYQSSDAGFFYHFLSVLLDNQVTLSGFINELNHAASADHRPYELYQALFDLKAMLALRPKRIKELSRIAQLDEPTDEMCVQYMHQLLTNSVTERPINETALIERYRRSVKKSVNPHWRRRDDAQDTDALSLQDGLKMVAQAQAMLSQDIKQIASVIISGKFRYYYRAPEQFNVVADFNDWTQTLIERNSISQSAFIVVTCYSIVFRSNPTRLQAWFMQLDLRHVVAREIAFQALWHANIPAAHNLLLSYKNQGFHDQIATITAMPLLKSKASDIKTAYDLDRSWYAYYASGDEEYVKKVLFTAVSSDLRDYPIGENNDVEKLMGHSIVAFAKRSVQEHFVSHREVLQIALRYVNQIPREHKAALTKLIAGASGHLSMMSGYGMKLFRGQYTPTIVDIIKAELTRITGCVFETTVSHDLEKMTCLVTLTTLIQAKAIIQHLETENAAAKITLIQTEEGNTLQIKLEQPDLEKLQATRTMASVTAKKQVIDPYTLAHTIAGRGPSGACSSND